MVLQQGELINIESDKNAPKFQSPCGVMVLQHKVFHPTSCLDGRYVSVPLRGYGLATLCKDLHYLRQYREFQSPCGVMVLQLFLEFNFSGEKW